MAIISDKYVTFQGTGHLVGMRQAFIRFAGCSVKCPIREVCDEPGSLENSGSDEGEGDIVEWALSEVGPGGWVCITGGEPCQQKEALMRLGIICEKADLRIHLQTSGVFRVPIRTDWLTVSPKVYASQLECNWGHECVVINDKKTIIDFAVLHAYDQLTKFYDYYLQPLWLPDNTSNIEETIEMVHRINRTGKKWKLTMQAHKYWGIK